MSIGNQPAGSDHAAFGCSRVIDLLQFTLTLDGTLMAKTRFALFAITLVSLMLAAPALAQTPVVRAVLFYSPTCPHCQKVITQDLPPLLEKYGSQLEIIGVDVTQPGGQALYLAAVERFHVPEDRIVVPMLIVGEKVLIGSGEIPCSRVAWP